MKVHDNGGKCLDPKEKAAHEERWGKMKTLLYSGAAMAVGSKVFEFGNKVREGSFSMVDQADPGGPAGALGMVGGGVQAVGALAVVGGVGAAYYAVKDTKLMKEFEGTVKRTGQTIKYKADPLKKKLVDGFGSKVRSLQVKVNNVLQQIKDKTDSKDGGR